MPNRKTFVGVLDRISGFPDEILCHILAFLPIRAAVRTSILSTRWRYLFASMSTLNLLRLPFSAYKTDDDTMNQFKNFVDRLLFYPKHVGLESFKLGKLFLLGKDDVRLHGWICAALSRGVKEIVLNPSNFHSLPSNLFTSQSLVTLKLWAVDGIVVPTNVCLPNLKTLHLHVEISRIDACRLISACVVLEELDMVTLRGEFYILWGDYYEISEIDINTTSLKILKLHLHSMTHCGRGIEYVVKVNAPNLVKFEYIDFVANCYAISDMKSLEKAVVRISQFKDTSYNLNGERVATHLLQAICNVRSLSLNSLLVEMLCTTPLEPVLAFPNVVELEFHKDHSDAAYLDWKATHLVEFLHRIQFHKDHSDAAYLDWKATHLVEFLHRVPILETLIIYSSSFPEACGALPKTVPNCLLFHLKEVQISFVTGDEHEFDLISYFVKHALVLEKLVASSFYHAEHPMQSVLSEKLSSISKKCQLEQR